MDTNVVALKNLYVSLGGSADDVADISTIADMINALCTVVAGGVLPAVSAEENGKVLKVVEGEWAVATDEISA